MMPNGTTSARSDHTQIFANFTFLHGDNCALCSYHQVGVA